LTLTGFIAKLLSKHLCQVPNLCHIGQSRNRWLGGPDSPLNNHSDNSTVHKMRLRFLHPFHLLNQQFLRPGFPLFRKALTSKMPVHYSFLKDEETYSDSSRGSSEELIMAEPQKRRSRWVPRISCNISGFVMILTLWGLTTLATTVPFSQHLKTKVPGTLTETSVFCK
jgi:hypothetical protein